MVRIAIFASGRGSNALNIIKYFQDYNYVKIELIVSNKKDAPVLNLGKQFDIQTVVINRKHFYKTNRVLEKLKAHQIDYVVLAGFLWLVPSNLVKAYSNRIVNIHPALLPKYGGKGMYGMNVHNAVKAANDTASGITIHYVNEHYDEGNIIFQASCPITPDDTPSTIAQKVHELEYKHFPVVIHQLIDELASE